MNNTLNIGEFAAKAESVARMLKVMANPHRLMVLCQLVEHGEMRVGDLIEATGLSQSALSQHLARLREDELVATRRESQAIWYRIADARCEALLARLHQLYCED